MSFSSIQLRKIIWPIEGKEHKKFLLMTGMMFCILFNFSALRSLKDGFIVTGIGAEAISFLKTYIVLPVAILMMIIYTKLSSIMSQQKVFYTIAGFFIVYFCIYSFILYPYPNFFYINPEKIDLLVERYPNFAWFIRIIGKWKLATLYTVAEIYGSMMLSLLFWQFANQITTTDEARRFYPMFGLLANIALPISGIAIAYFLSDNFKMCIDFKFTPIFYIIILCSLLSVLFYAWINILILKNNITENNNKDLNVGKKSRKKKISLIESIKIIFTSKYLGFLAVLVIAYGVSVNLVEGVWKANIKLIYSTAESYTLFMAKFQSYQGIVAIVFMIVGSNIIRRVSWFRAAILTPLMILITGIIFFACIIFDKVFALYCSAMFLGTGPIAAAILIGSIQNILSKATKYSLFDATKEMAYIPLDNERKTKGKAAVDVIGGRLGKSGGAVIQSTFLILFPRYSLQEGAPYFAIIFLVVVLLWLISLYKLSDEYNAIINNS